LKLLVFGGSGMLGHKLVEVAANRKYNVSATYQNQESFRATGSPHCIATPFNSPITPWLFSVADDIDRLLVMTKPDAVVNCIGITIQNPIIHNPALVYNINSLFPHSLAEACKRWLIPLVHLSTDCVFSGKKGNYREKDNADGVTLYGRSKLIGEPKDYALVLRTSMIGLEVQRRGSLIEWLLQQDTCPGFVNHYFTGFTTEALSKLILDLLPFGLRGVYHLAGPLIDKYALLSLLAYRLQSWKSIEVFPVEDNFCDRSLSMVKLRKAVPDLKIPDWKEMLDGLAGEIMAKRSTC